MKEILNDSLTIPGVIGGFFYHKDRGVLAVELPAVFKADKLEKMARMLLKIFSSGQTNLNGVAEVSICYDETILVARAMNDISFLILLCETKINLELLGMSLNLSMEDAHDRLDQQLRADDLPDDEPPPTALVPMPVNSHAVVDIEKESPPISNAPPDEVLQGIQTCLAKVIGPIAQIVFQDAMHQWKQYATSNSNDLPLLMNIVLAEIDDPDHKRKFQQLMTDYIENY